METAKIEINVKSLECPICLETLSDPRGLPCQHSLCGPKSSNKCLQMLDPRNAGKIKCPVCQMDHEMPVTAVPPNFALREMLEALGTANPKKMCAKHGHELTLRCVRDKQAICALCVAGDHAGHQVEGLYASEQKRLVDFWDKESAKLETLQRTSRTRKETIRQTVEYLENQFLQEDSLDKQLGELFKKRDRLAEKLHSKNFDPEDKDVLALKEFMDHLKATTESQKEASQEVQEKTKQIAELVTTRAKTYCQGIAEACPTEREEFLASSSAFLLNRKSQRRRTAGWAQPLNQGSTVLALGSFGNSQKMDLHDKLWTDCYSPFMGDSFDAVTFKKKIFVIGAETATERGNNNVKIFNISSDKWLDGPKLKVKRRKMAACVVLVESTIYVLGGYTSSNEALDSMETLKVDANGFPDGQWKLLSTPMPMKRYGCAVAAVDQRIVVTGGNSGTKSLFTVDIFDTFTKQWSYGPLMRYARSHHTMEEVNGMIYVMGGQNNNSPIDACEKLDLQLGRWTLIERLPRPRHCLGSTVVNGRIYVVGGYMNGTESEKKSVQIYEPLANSWSEGPALKTATMSHTRCVSW